ncbi:MAG TPA: hypothetical protein VMG12_06965 [Polyangiaceae bacterium]|nr:hypothetical protein [Polyangiaceae bacterium]
MVGIGLGVLCGCSIDPRTVDVAVAPEQAEPSEPAPDVDAPEADAGDGVPPTTHEPDAGAPPDETLPEVPLGGCTDGDITSCGPAREVGRCKRGASTCSGGTWGACEGSVEAIAEVCGNGVDDDCDGETDPVSACGACRDNPCQNGGVCQEQGDGGYRCSCRGFLGDDCELPMFERLIPVEGQSNALLVSLSDDGRRGAGFCLTPTGGGPPTTFVRWSLEQGFSIVAGYPSEPAQYVSGDGAVIADEDMLAADGVTRTLADWNPTGREFVQDYSVSSINRNGSVVAGIATFSTDGGVGHFRWSEASGFLTLPTVGGNFDAPPVISSDGSTVVGGDRNGAYRFTTATGLQTIVPDARATGVSSNGSVIIGSRSSESGSLVFRWTEATGAVDQPGDCYRAMLSLDGTRSAMNCLDPFTGSGDVVVQNGSERSRLVDVLVAAGVPGVPPVLELVEVMSGDGKTLAGQYGDVESGLQFLWMARLR